MEELTSKLASSFELSGPNNPAAPHPRFSFHKTIGGRSEESNQEKRRKQLLEQQKKRRFDYVNHIRRLVDDDWKDVEDEDQKEDSIEMECEMPRIRRPPRRYKNQLMLSEWLVEVPSNLSEEWLLVLCPAGRRNLIVAAKGITKAYNKTGSCVNNFSSLLPGGNERSFDYTLLDCIFCDNDKTFYILDMMCWKKNPIFESETEFRFYWLHSKLEEIPDLKVDGKMNPYKFIPLPNHPCTPESIVQALEAPKVFSGVLDGLLFYHKGSHYIHGLTPLVGWLKVYMLPEILNIPIPTNYQDQCPKNYTSAAEHIKWYEIKRERKENRKIIKKSSFAPKIRQEPMVTETKSSCASQKNCVGPMVIDKQGFASPKICGEPMVTERESSFDYQNIPVCAEPMVTEKEISSKICVESIMTEKL